MIILIAAALLAAAERSRRLAFRPAPFLRRHFASDVVYLLTGFVAGGAGAAAYVSSGSAWVGDALGLPRFAALGLPLWVSAPLALLALDAGNYLAHYLLHRFDLLWEFHKIHHSSPALDWLATFRSHIVEQALRRLLAPLLLILAGFPPAAVALAGSAFLAWVMLIHSNLRINLSFLEPFLVTPRLHRAHHLDAPEVRNLGTVFSFWDSWRGTLVRDETGEGARFGNGEDSYPQSWHPQLFEPFVRIGRKGFLAENARGD
jgi:sterol desaturase/sphingolipid hydroxylase (fatty acid hydroxylase superfamily)